MSELPPIIYTLCFCLVGDRVLMLLRNKDPHRGLYNGLGGKIEVGETPRVAVIREVREEAAIDLLCADSLQYGGVLTWDSPLPEHGVGGSHLFMATFADASVVSNATSGAEGDLHWLPVQQVIDGECQVVSNIPIFLPLLLEAEAATRYHFNYDECDQIVNYTVSDYVAKESSQV